MADISFDLSKVKPLLASLGKGLGLGQAPDSTPKDMGNQPAPAMQAPAQPAATPPVAGFLPWSGDGKNQGTVASGITAPNTPMPSFGGNGQPPSLFGGGAASAAATDPFAAYATRNPSGSYPSPQPAPQLAPLPTSAPTPQQAYQTNMNMDMAANPTLYGQPQLQGQGLLKRLAVGGVGALASLSSGLRKDGGNPLAGLDYLRSVQDRDAALPGQNAAIFDLRNVKPLRDAAAAQQAQAQLQDTQSQTQQRAALAAKAQAQADNVGDDSKRKAKDIADAAKLGSKPVYDENGTLTGYAPDETSTVYQKNQALAQLEEARTEAASAQADLAKSKNDPKSPLFQQAQARLNVARQNAGTAMARLNLSTQEFGFNQEKFFNPQPTATERSKGDLAQSAVERVQEMRAVKNKHPDWFGPGAGRLGNVQAAIGSQDPDMQTYMSAAQYLSDHSAGVFGGRGKYITEALHGLTDPHSNPAAIGAALDEAERAAQGFVKAGTLHGRPAPGTGTGGNAPPASGGAGGVTVTAPDGSVHAFKDQATANSFKQRAGIK